MTKKGELPKYPDFTGIEGYTKNKVVTIDKKLFDTPIVWTVKEDGMNTGCYLDDNGELQIRTSNLPKISEDLRQRFLKLPYAQNIKELLTELNEDYPEDYCVLFGEFMLRGKSPKKVAFREGDSFKAFDLYIGALKRIPPLVQWKSFEVTCDDHKIPRVELVEITTVYTFDELMEVRERLLAKSRENQWEGVVGKVWITNEFGSFTNIVKEKPVIEEIRNPDNPEDNLPDLPESEITGALEKTLGEIGIDKFCDAKIAMPIIAIKIKEQCEKHGCRKPGKRTFELYRERVMRM
jgi:hypothetical protein